MSEIKIHLRFNVESGKKDILIEYESDGDALPFEHEERHRQLLEDLLGKGILEPDEVGNIRVGRIEKDAEGNPVVIEETPQRQKQGTSN